MSDMPEYTQEQKDAIVRAAWRVEGENSRERAHPFMLGLWDALHPKPVAREVLLVFDDGGRMDMATRYSNVGKVLVDGKPVWPKEKS